MLFEERFWSRVDKSGDCWIWTGCKDSNGYGKVKVPGGTDYAHRISYKLMRGGIPYGRELDHLCRLPWCVKPEHLEPVSHQENVQRGNAGKWFAEVQKSKTHCPKGHPYSETNTISKGGSRTWRACRICNAISCKKRRAAKRQAETRVMRDGREVCGALAWQARRMEVFRRDGGICQICLKEIKDYGIDTEPFDIDHIRGRGLGGGKRDDRMENLQLLCQKCHRLVKHG